MQGPGVEPTVFAMPHFRGLTEPAAMTLLTRSARPTDHVESPAADLPGRSADALLEHADLADLARAARQVLDLADSAARRWRPKTMHEWLT